MREQTAREKILVEGLARIASNLGRGSFRPSEIDNAKRPLRIEASETLHKAGYLYQENPDGWILKGQ